MRGHIALWMLLAACSSSSDDAGDAAPTYPVAHDDTIVVGEDQTSAAATIFANDDDYRGSYDLAKIVTAPAHGTVDSSGAYRPDTAYFGPDQFTYSLTYNGVTSTANVAVTVTSDGIGYEQSAALDDAPADTIATGDLDGDGRPDLVTSRAQDDSVSVLLNRSTPGVYKLERSTFEGGHSPYNVAVADFDGDGRADIVTASPYDGVVLLHNTTPAGGPLSFAAPAYLALDGATQVAVVDLDGDGKPDLAATGASKLAVWLNTGAFTFGPRADFSTPSSAIGLLVVDADLDGAPDLAVLSAQPGTISLFLNAMTVGVTTPAFAARIDRATGSSPRRLFLADLDRDGDLEVAVVHDGGAMWIYANQAQMPGTPSYEAARVLDLPSAGYGAPVIAPLDHDHHGAIDLFEVSNGQTASVQLLNTSAAQGAYTFATAPVKLGDLQTRRAVSYFAPTAVIQVDLDGVAPDELVVTSAAGTSALYGL